VLRRRPRPVDPYPRPTLDNSEMHDKRTKWFVVAVIAGGLGFIALVCYTQFTGIVG